jgi:hypothetical protein
MNQKKAKLLRKFTRFYGFKLRSGLTKDQLYKIAKNNYKSKNIFEKIEVSKQAKKYDII